MEMRTELIIGPSSSVLFLLGFELTDGLQVSKKDR